MNVKAKLELATTNKVLHAFFYNRLILDFVLEIDHKNMKSPFLYNNVTKITTTTDRIDLTYLANFANFVNLKVIGVTCINFADSLFRAKAFVAALSHTVESIYVAEDNGGLIKVALHFFQKETFV